VAKTVSTLQSLLSVYTHPDRTFLATLNEILPQLASKGIWKDLTFEQSITLEDGDRFFTLPEEADSILHAIVNNRPSPVQPLWNTYVNEGATSGRSGRWYGVEDAGYIPTKEVLSSEHFYALVAFSDFEWGSVLGTNRVAAQNLSVTDEVVIEYEDFQGAVRTVTWNPEATSGPRHIPTSPVKNIRSIKHTGFDVPCRIVAVPIEHYGTFSSPGASIANLSAWADYPSAYLTLFPDPPTSAAYLYDAAGSGLVSAPFLPTSPTDTSGGTTAYPGGTGSWEVYAFPDSWLGDVQDANGTGLKTVAILKGDGVTRYRLFRQQASGNQVHLLLRKAMPTLTGDEDIVCLDNVSALKYAILANVAEFNNDLTQARGWWAEAERELNEELSKTLGAATPQVRFDPSGGLGGVEAIT
jgi:hypothetical protein